MSVFYLEDREERREVAEVLVAEDTRVDGVIVSNTTLSRSVSDGTGPCHQVPPEPQGRVGQCGADRDRRPERSSPDQTEH